MTPLRKTSLSEQTTAQNRFWAVLQEESNRVLPLQELCLMTGYQSISPWYEAMKDETFRARVASLGVMTRRYASYEAIIPLAENADEEWQKDTIDIRRLTGEYPKHWGAAAFRLNFTYVRILP